MVYRNKLYIAFDGDTDMAYYLTLKMWKANGEVDFNFYNAHDLNLARDTSSTESIKARLRERMANSRVMLLLVGEKTKNLRKFVPWEIELARKKDIPIIVSNLNGKRDFDGNRCPSAIKDGTTTVHISFEQNIVAHALNHFPDWYHANKDVGVHKNHILAYPASIYKGGGFS